MLRRFEEILDPDAQWKIIKVLDPVSGKERSLEIADLHRVVAEMNYANGVPDDVRRYFAVAQNLFIYSWFHYDFLTVVELQCWTGVELALKRKLGYGRKGLAFELLNPTRSEYHKATTPPSTARPSAMK